MTLNITILTERHIYQCADYRFTDLETGGWYDEPCNQKIFVVAGNTWLASVCYNGVGRTTTLEVSRWLGDVCDATTHHDSLDSFLTRLQDADSWLSSAAPIHRRHSFVVAAYVGRKPVLSLVSNYERFNRQPEAEATNRLEISQWDLTQSKTFVHGQPQELARPQRRILAALATKTSETGRVFTALARVNQHVASHNRAVSPSCFTTYIRRTGEGNGCPHEISIPANFEQGRPIVRASRGLRVPIQYDNRQTVRQFSFAFSWPTDDYHAIQLEDKPESPDVHSNYGAYLLNHKSDVDGAENAFRRALEIDPRHANALGNLANVMVRRARPDEADVLYRKALTIAPGQEHASFCYASLLQREGKSSARIREIVESGVRSSPKSGRLHSLLGEVELSDGRFDSALAAFQHARELGAEQSTVEAGYAIALHGSGAPTKTCIDAYWTAIAVNPTNGGLYLNIAQLLFIVGQEDQAERMLQQAWQFGLNASSQLEALFYSIAHSTFDPEATVSAIGRLLAAKQRMHWNMDDTLERIRAKSPARADLLGELFKVLTGNAPAGNLTTIVNQLSSADERAD